MKVIVTKLQQEPEGYWSARASVDGHTVPVDTKFGSWEANVRDGERVLRKEVLPQVKAALQDRLPATAKQVRR